MFRKIFFAAIFMMSSYLAFAQYSQELFDNNVRRPVEHMYYSGGHLYLGGHVLSDAETMESIGYELYNSTYSGARKQYSAGKVLTIVGGCVSGLGLSLMIGGLAADDLDVWLGGAVAFALGQPVLGGGIAFMCVGKGRLNWLAEDYNNRMHRPAVSFGATRSGLGFALNF